MSTRDHVLLGATLITKLSQEVLVHKVLSSRGLPEQKPEVRMNEESESSKNLGKSFQVDRRSSKSTVCPKKLIKDSNVENLGEPNATPVKE